MRSTVEAVKKVGLSPEKFVFEGDEVKDCGLPGHYRESVFGPPSAPAL